MADDIKPEAMPLVPMSSQPHMPTPALEPWSPPAPAPPSPLSPAIDMFAAAPPPPVADPMELPAVLPTADTEAAPTPSQAPPGAAAAPPWTVREQSSTATPWAPTPPPPPKAQKGNKAKGIAGVVLLVVIAIGVKVGLGMVAKEAITATNKTYHAPASINGSAQSTDPSVTTITNQMKQGFELPSLQNSHTEAAAYVDAQDHLAYLIAFGQDNAGRDVVRENAGLKEQFSDVTESTVVNQEANGLHVSCGTVSDVTSGSFQACTWYNADAFGAFADYGSTSPTDTATLLMSTLKTMVA